MQPESHNFHPWSAQQQGRRSRPSGTNPSKQRVRTPLLSGLPTGPCGPPLLASTAAPLVNTCLPLKKVPSLLSWSFLSFSFLGLNAFLF